MKTLLASAVSGALLATGSLLLPSPAAVAADTCHGQAATVTPDANGNLVGTPLADVIVAHAGQRVDAGLGDDLICLVGTEAVGPADAGPGDDTVDATQATAGSATSLGAGADTYTAGPGRDAVYATVPEGDSFPAPDPVDTEKDVISTGGGDDTVFSGALGEPNTDEIATGRGDDRVNLAGLDHALSLDVGGGNNLAIVTLAAPETEAWDVNVGNGTISFDDATWSWMGQLHRWYFTMADGQAPSSLVFLGTVHSDTVFVSGPGLVPHFRMGDGADVAGSLTVPGGTFFLGPGRDTLTLGRFDFINPGFPIADLRVDLLKGKARFGNIASPVKGVEKLKSGASRLRVYGSLRADRIIASGCDVLVDGRAGNDVLTRLGRTSSACTDMTTLLIGGIGGDLLFGSPQTDDVLLGGLGFDRARGMGGTDTCKAEVTRGCEVT